MLRTHRHRSTRPSHNNKPTNAHGVVEPDSRIVFAVLAVGMLVGALAATPSKNHAQVQAGPPATAVAAK